ncbi:J domain-containing protein [Roseobacter sp.]|uniref:J domain-containing protein n=1 Tax=Roseobacter sp. TaxID=1907202 RepID=UPI0029668DC0|nr:J domain-containing protein [Roseobacter sp.]MDW3180733.1 J domain-containing protein [Roseobacter sp.]
MSATPEHAARVLGLTDEATLADVRRVRRALALKYHPDRSSDPVRSSRHMARINAAADTLIAHLRDQAPKKPDAECRERQEFAQRNTARRASGTGQTSRKSGDRAKAAAGDKASRTDKNGARPESKTTAHVMTAQPSARKTSPAESLLIRLATSSYRTVLDRIGTVAPAPTIDTRVLCYPAAH